ncbi:MAG: metalloprotease [Evtepia gabavorous]
MFSYGEECLVALAGPAASVLLAIGAATWGRHFGGADAYLLTGVSLALGVFNLLPIGPLDGGRILRAVASRWAGPDAGDRVCGLLTKVLGCGPGRPGRMGVGEERKFYPSALRRLAAVAAGREPVKEREPSGSSLGTDGSRFRLAGGPRQSDSISVFSPYDSWSEESPGVPPAGPGGPDILFFQRKTAR